MKWSCNTTSVSRLQGSHGSHAKKYGGVKFFFASFFKQKIRDQKRWEIFKRGLFLNVFSLKSCWLETGGRWIFLKSGCTFFFRGHEVLFHKNLS